MADDLILLGHGSGGILSQQLLDQLILPTLGGEDRPADDAAVLPACPGRLAFTTDSYVVDPLFFPGGDIGCLSIYGTVNDLAMAGARPLAISVGLIIEEGLPREELRRVLLSMRAAAERCAVRIVTGDTKVVPRGRADRLFITTSGIGELTHEQHITGSGARPGDRLLISGAIGDHGMAVLAARENLALLTPIASDCAPLHGLAAELVARVGEGLHVLRDPTRGGLASALKEIARQSSAALFINEAALPIRSSVAAACAILGFDPLHVANEGKLVACVAAESADLALAIMAGHSCAGSPGPAVIGEVRAGEGGTVLMRTAIGGLRTVEMLTGEQLPRIC